MNDRDGQLLIDILVLLGLMAVLAWFIREALMLR